jgi:haloalkane dehalogenase
MTRALENFRAAPLQRVTLAGSELTYRVFGEGPAVLFVHGWPLSGITYRHQIEALEPYYRCIVPDLPGAGDTPWSPSIRESVTDFTTMLHALVEHLRLERLAFVAHDSGAGIARLVAAELGSRVTAMVLQNTEIPDHMPFLLRVLKLAAKSPLAPQLHRLLGNRAFRHSPLAFGECFGDRTLIEGEFYEACVKPLLRDMTGHSAMLAHYDLGWTSRLAAAHARIQAPIHLFWGGSDTFFSLARARAMRSQFTRGGELEVIPHGKLYVHEEAPEELSRFALAQLQRAFSSERAGALAF